MDAFSRQRPIIATKAIRHLHLIWLDALSWSLLRVGESTSRWSIWPRLSTILNFGTWLTDSMKNLGNFPVACITTRY